MAKEIPLMKINRAKQKCENALTEAVRKAFSDFRKETEILDIDNILLFWTDEEHPTIVVKTSIGRFINQPYNDVKKEMKGK